MHELWWSPSRSLKRHECLDFVSCPVACNPATAVQTTAIPNSMAEKATKMCFYIAMSTKNGPNSRNHSKDGFPSNQIITVLYRVVCHSIMINHETPMITPWFYDETLDAQPTDSSSRPSCSQRSSEQHFSLENAGSDYDTNNWAAWLIPVAATFPKISGPFPTVDKHNDKQESRSRLYYTKCPQTWEGDQNPVQFIFLMFTRSRGCWPMVARESQSG